MHESEIVGRLNETLHGELGALITYSAYAASMSGPYKAELSQFILAKVAHKQLNAQHLANMIVFLKGEPIADPYPTPIVVNDSERVDVVSEIEHTAIRVYVTHLTAAEEYAYRGVALRLEDMMRDEVGHYEETRRILRSGSF